LTVLIRIQKPGIGSNNLFSEIVGYCMAE